MPEGLSFACAVKDEAKPEVPERVMKELSSQWGQEAIFMCVQTTVDFFIYSHWQEGEMVRQIQYCADEGWYEVTGKKEDWELRLLNESEKQLQLSYLDLERLGKNPNSAEYIDALRCSVEIENVWSGQVLVEGSFYPMATASDIYGIVMKEQGLANP